MALTSYFNTPRYWRFSTVFSPSRAEARQFFFDTWKKYQDTKLLSALEEKALDIILMHPEYQAVLENREKYIGREFSPQSGEANPFLHLSMHLAIREQLAIDQPIGIKSYYAKLLKKLGNAHDTEHVMLECMAEMIWQAQRARSEFDGALYLNCLAKQLR